jgi:hypothetical protein
MGGKLKQRVCIKIWVILGTSATKTLEMLCETFGEHPLSQEAVFEWCSRFEARQVSVNCILVRNSGLRMQQQKLSTEVCIIQNVT